MTADMLAWLKAAIAGDKALAERTSGGDWEHVVDDHGRGQVDAAVWSNAISYYVVEKVSSGPCHREDAEHIARHDPRDTIARCEAELAELARHDPNFAGDCPVCDEVSPCESVQIKARGYRHREGFNPAWLSR